MIVIDWMNIASFDLNLLKAFSAVYAERNVTRAAARIGLAQPSMSNALSRLRAVFEDQLFVKTPKGMVPTATADELAPIIDAALARVEDALGTTRPFDPTTSQATVTIAAPDNLTLSMAPALAQHLAEEATGMDLRFRPFAKDRVFDELDRGEVDIALSRFAEIPARFYQRDLLQDGFVVLARKGHPCTEGQLSIDRYCSAAHILVSFRNDAKGAVDDTLAAMGKSRRIALVLAQFGLVPDVVARTDYLATVPASVGRDLAERSGCEVHNLPFGQPEWTNQVVWSPQSNADPAKRFAVDALLSLDLSSGTPKSNHS